MNTYYLKVYFPILFTAVILFLSSCKGDDDAVDQVGQVSFYFSNPHAEGRVEEVPLSKVVFSIEDADGSLILEDEEVILDFINGNYESEPLSIKAGSYTIVEFLVLGDDDVVYYATPKEGSDLAYLITEPLPIDFMVLRDEITILNPEVISTDEGSALDFGYTQFKFSIIETFDVLIGLFAFSDLDDEYQMIDGEMSVYAGADSLFTTDLFAATNKVIFHDNFPSFTIQVTKEGYQPFSYEFSSDSLKNYQGTSVYGSLEIIMENEDDLLNGLIAYYPFNGNAIDESENTNDGIVNGATLTMDRKGNNNSAYQFDGVDDFIDLGNATTFELANYDNFTISVWVKSESATIATSEGIFSKYISAGNNRVYALYLVADHNAQFAFWENGAITNDHKVNQEIDNEWNNLVVKKESDKIILYVNGSMVQSETITFPILKGSSANAMIGAFNFSSALNDRNFNGVIDDLRIYNRALNISEIETLFIDK